MGALSAAFAASPAHRPLFENPLNIPPASPVVGYSLVDGVLDPFSWIMFERFHKMIRDERRQ
jgi:hypothetical protein